MSETAPSRSEATTEPQAPLIEPMPASKAESFYRATLTTLFDDAWNHRRLKMLSDAATRMLAHTIVACGPQATGDILLRLGEHIVEVARQRDALREAERAKEEGRATH